VEATLVHLWFHSHARRICPLSGNIDAELFLGEDPGWATLSRGTKEALRMRIGHGPFGRVREERGRAGPAITGCGGGSG